MPGCDGAELGGLFAAAGRRFQHRQYPHLQRVHRSAYSLGMFSKTGTIIELRIFMFYLFQIHLVANLCSMFG